jgi:hypothetical protein
MKFEVDWTRLRAGDSLWTSGLRLRGVTADAGKKDELDGARASGSGLSRGACCVIRGGVTARDGSICLVFCSKKLLKYWLDSSGL